MATNKRYKFSCTHMDASALQPEVVTDRDRTLMLPEVIGNQKNNFSTKNRRPMLGKL